MGRRVGRLIPSDFHRFNLELHCEHCGYSWKQQQRRPVQCTRGLKRYIELEALKAAGRDYKGREKTCEPSS